ncbi:hypothetical protein BDZ89DRAFT_907441, partial [Hymenopellis radicata]
GDTNLVEEGIDRLPVKEDNEAAVMAFDTLKIKLKLSDGWRRTFPDEKNYTYQHTNLKMARLDRIYVTEELFEEWDIEEPAIKTDHQMVSVQLTCDEAPDTGTGRWSIPEIVIKDKEFVKYALKETHETSKKMEGVQNHRRTEECNPQTLFEEFKEKIRWKARQRQKALLPKINKQIAELEAGREDVLNDVSMNDQTKMFE